MKIPLIKVSKIEMLMQNIECVSRHPYNRDNLRDCVLSLYPGKDEKSVFRGMVIPSLRQLGLIVGYSDLIRLSANGRLLLESRSKEEREFHRVLRAVFLEIDVNKFTFIERIKTLTGNSKELLEQYFIKKLSQKIEAVSQFQKVERIKKWLKILEQCGFLKKQRGIIYLFYRNLEQAEKDLRWQAKASIFKKLLFAAYSSLSSDAANIVDIVDLREKVALSLYSEKKEILTERQFDELLRSLPPIADDYMISFGHSMGAEEKLFVYQNDYYRTLSITFLKKGE